MSNTPLMLDDDDFADEAPPGYRSQTAKDRYVPLMATLLGGTFVLQMILPFIIMVIGMPMMISQQFSRGMPQYSKMGIWQDEFWYPTLSAPGGRGGGKLQAMDYRGKQLDLPAIDVDLQPEWLVADGERLWAVSKDAVAEVRADGTPSLVMRPARYLSNPSPPLLHEGKLAVVDRDHPAAPFTLYVFDRGEWQAQGEFVITLPPVRSRLQAPADPNVSDNAAAEGPADALLPSIPDDDDFELEAGEIQRLKIVNVAGEYHVLCVTDLGTFHHIGLPFKNAAPSDISAESWHFVDHQMPEETLTIVDGAPAILGLSTDYNAVNLWQFSDGQWKKTAHTTSLGSRPGSKLSAMITPDGAQSFAILENLGGMSHVLIRLQTGDISKIARLSAAQIDPFGGGQLWLQFWSQGSTLLLMLIMLIGSTWLMHRYRDPNYFKGRVPVAYASLFRRAIAVLIDALLINVPVTVVWYLWYREQDQPYLQLVESLISDPKEFIPGLKFPVIFSLTCLFGWTFALWIMQAWGGFSPGKLLCGVRVARTNLQQPGLLRSLIRILVGMVESCFGVVIPVALIAFLQNRQRLGDLVAGTIVVRAGSLRAGRKALLAAEEARAQL